MPGENQNQPEVPSADTAAPAAQPLSGDDETLQKARAWISERHSPEELARLELPEVKIPGGTVTISESAAALFKAIAPSKQLFYRGGVVVELVKEGEGDGGGPTF